MIYQLSALETQKPSQNIRRIRKQYKCDQPNFHFYGIPLNSKTFVGVLDKNQPWKLEEQNAGGKPVPGSPQKDFWDDDISPCPGKSGVWLNQARQDSELLRNHSRDNLAVFLYLLKMT